MKESHINRQDLINDLKQENIQLKAQNEYARSLIRSLLDNSDEYARQRAEEFLNEKETEQRCPFCGRQIKGNHCGHCQVSLDQPECRWAMTH